MAPPPQCEKLVNSVTGCSLPTIVQCDPEKPPICTADSTVNFERRCLKCKNTFGGKLKDGPSTKPLTSAALKQKCHKARQEVGECTDTVLKCGKQPAQCGGRATLAACDEGDLLICETLQGNLKGKLSSSNASQSRNFGFDRTVGMLVIATTILVVA